MVVREAVLNTVSFLQRLWNSSPRGLSGKYFLSLDPSLLLPDYVKSAAVSDRKRSFQGRFVPLPPIDITESGLEGVDAKRMDYGSVDSIVGGVKKEGSSVNRANGMNAIKNTVNTTNGMNAIKSTINTTNGMNAIKSTINTTNGMNAIKNTINTTNGMNAINHTNTITTKPQTKTEAMANLLLQTNSTPSQSKICILEEDSEKADNPFEESESETSVHHEPDTKKTYMGMARRSYDGP